MSERSREKERKSGGEEERNNERNKRNVETSPLVAPTDTIKWPTKKERGPSRRGARRDQSGLELRFKVRDRVQGLQRTAGFFCRSRSAA